MSYTRTIYNQEIGFVVRYKVDNIGYILKNKIEIFYGYFVGVYNDIYQFVNDEKTKKPIHENKLLEVIKKYSRFSNLQVFLTEKPYNTMKNIKDFVKEYGDDNFNKVVIKFGTKSSKYLSKKLP